MVIQILNLKVLPSLLHGYHTSQLQNIAFLSTGFPTRGWQEERQTPRDNSKSKLEGGHFLQDQET